MPEWLESEGPAPSAVRETPLQRTLSAIVRYWSDAGSFVVGASLVACIYFEERWLQAGTRAPFSDYWEHAAVMHALLQNPWHPQNPHLVSAASSPRFGPVAVLNALFARAVGLDARGALQVAAVVQVGLFVTGIWLFFRTYFKDARAGLYGLIVMLGSWWQAWTFSSVYQPKVLLSVACYPWVAAFGLTLLGLAFTVRVLRGARTPTAGAASNRPPLLALAALVLWSGVVFLTHQLTAMMALTAFMLLCVTEPAVPLQRRSWVCGSAVAGCVLSGFWPYFSVWRLLAGGQTDAGWLGQSVHAAVTGTVTVAAQRHRFYHPGELVAALGLALLGVLALPYFLLQRRRLFVGLGALGMLLPFAVNAFVPLPLGHRFLLLSVFFLQVAVVWLFMIFTPGSAEYPRVLDRPWRRHISLTLVWAVLVVFGVHNVQRTVEEWRYFEQYARHGESPYTRYARQVAARAGNQAVVMGEVLTLWPIPAFGPKVVALEHENPFVPDSEHRLFAVERFFARDTPDAERLALLDEYHVTHVVTKRQPVGPVSRFLSQCSSRERLFDGYWLFTLHPTPRP
jgi:hypothetical protein